MRGITTRESHPNTMGPYAPSLRTLISASASLRKLFAMRSAIAYLPIFALLLQPNAYAYGVRYMVAQMVEW